MTDKKLPPHSAERDGIRIRSMRLTDVDGLYHAAIASIDSVGAWLPWLRPGYQRGDTELWVASSVLGWGDPRGMFQFVIESAADQRFLGGINIKVFDVPGTKRLGNIGYWVRSDGVGRGVATAAVKLISEFGFKELKLLRLEIGADVANVASRRVAEKAGYQYEGVLRHGLITNGRPVDQALYGMIAADLEPR